MVLKILTRPKLPFVLLHLVLMAASTSSQDPGQGTYSDNSTNDNTRRKLFLTLKERKKLAFGGTLPIFWNDTSTCAFQYTVLGFVMNPKDCNIPTLSVHRKIHFLCTSQDYIKEAFYSIALILGVPGSVFTMVTVFRMPYIPSTLYIGVLSLADLLSLIVYLYLYVIKWAIPLFLRRFMELDITMSILQPTFSTLSHLILALICLERFVSVRFPLHKGKVYTMRNTWLTVVISFLISSIPLSSDILAIVFRNIDALDIFDKAVIYQTFYVFVPSISIIILTVSTAFQLKKVARRRQHMSSSTSFGSKMESDLTRMMFMTATAFIILVLPPSAVEVLDTFYHWQLATSKYFCPLNQAIFRWIREFNYGLRTFNHAINFYIYYFGAAGFRRKFHRAICCQKKLF